jgi:hypothetical protein
VRIAKDRVKELERGMIRKGKDSGLGKKAEKI